MNKKCTTNDKYVMFTMVIFMYVFWKKTLSYKQIGGL